MLAVKLTMKNLFSTQTSNKYKQHEETLTLWKASEKPM